MPWATSVAATIMVIETSPKVGYTKIKQAADDEGNSAQHLPGAGAPVLGLEPVGELQDAGDDEGRRDPNLGRERCRDDAERRRQDEAAEQDEDKAESEEPAPALVQPSAQVGRRHGMPPVWLPYAQASKARR